MRFLFPFRSRELASKTGNRSGIHAWKFACAASAAAQPVHLFIGLTVSSKIFLIRSSQGSATFWGGKTIALEWKVLWWKPRKNKARPQSASESTFLHFSAPHA